MFGGSGPKRFPVWLRIPAGVFALAFGALTLGMSTGALGARAADSPPAAFFVAGALGAAIMAAGLLLLIGAFVGVGDYGERAASMPVFTRLLLNAFGYAFSFGLVVVFAMFALSPEINGGAGVAALVGRSLFGVFALLVGGITTYSLGRAFTRLLRGLPYDDDSPPPQQN